MSGVLEVGLLVGFSAEEAGDAVAGEEVLTGSVAPYRYVVFVSCLEEGSAVGGGGFLRRESVSILVLFPSYRVREAWLRTGCTCLATACSSDCGRDGGLVIIGSVGPGCLIEVPNNGLDHDAAKFHKRDRCARRKGNGRKAGKYANWRAADIPPIRKLDLGAVSVF